MHISCTNTKMQLVSLIIMELLIFSRSCVLAKKKKRHTLKGKIILCFLDSLFLKYFHGLMTRHRILRLRAVSPEWISHNDVVDKLYLQL